MGKEYKKLYADRLERGQLFQDYVMQYLYGLAVNTSSLAKNPIGCFTTKEYQYRYGESATRIEIKYDREFDETTRLFIEREEKSDPDKKGYQKAGIWAEYAFDPAVPDARGLYRPKVLIQGTYKEFYVFNAQVLRDAFAVDAQLKLADRRWKLVPNKWKTSRGYLLTQMQLFSLSLYMEKHNPTLVPFTK